MSRFNDWSLVPKENTKYTIEEMDKLQLQLASDLYDEIDKELDKKFPR
jgi:hypothetical protein